MIDHYGRIQLLLSQNRFDMAERDLRMMLAEEPRDAVAHSLLALCLLHDTKRLDEASEQASQAVGLAPDDPFPHYALALCLLNRNRYAEAEASIGEALRLDPYDADAFSVLARSRLARQQYQSSLEAAEQGLAIDPEHIPCGNLRSISLERLGRGDEAIVSSSDTLRRDPDDPMAHAAHGFTLLNGGRYSEAQLAFREALRLDPENEMARLGMIDALNNRSLIFRVVHRFYVAMSRLNSKAAFGLILGAWLLIQVLGRLADTFPALGPLILPIILMYIGFVVLTWIANPLFNTFLRFHPFGQHLLDRSQRWASNLIAPCLTLAVFGLIMGWATSGFELGVLASAYWIGMAIPIAATFAMPTPKRKLVVGAATLVIAMLPVIGLLQAVSVGSLEPFFGSFKTFAYSLLGIQIASSLIAASPVQK